MSAAGRAVSELDLHAYVDAELAADLRAEVEAWLAQHPEDAAQVVAWRRQKEELHGRFDGVLAEPLPTALEDAVTRRRTGAGLATWLRAAAAVALVAIGAAGGWGLRGWQAPGDVAATQFVRQAMGAHVVYAPEVRHPVEVGADEEAHLVTWLTKRIGQPVRAPHLAAAGFRLVGGRLLPDSGQPAAQFMYEDAAGRRAMLYIRSGRLGRDTAFRYVSDGGVSAFYWIDGPMGYVLTAKIPREELQTIARLVYDQLEN